METPSICVQSCFFVLIIDIILFVKDIHNLRLKHANKTSQVPIKNLSDYDIDTLSLEYGSNNSFVDKSKFIKRELEVELETLAPSVDELVSQEQKEEFHELLRQTK